MSLQLEQIKDYGLSEKKLSQIVEDAKQYGNIETVVAALNNADFYGVLLPSVAEKMEHVISGMKQVQNAVSADKLLVYLPDFANQAIVEKINAFDEIEVVTGIVDARENQNNVVAHFMTYLKLAESTDSAYLSVDGSDAKEQLKETVLGDLLKDKNQVKGFFNGYEFFDTTWIDKKLLELPVKAGLFQPIYENQCVVCETEKHLKKARKQSCGKCVFCREGLLQLQYMEKEITEGRGKAEYIGLIRELGQAMVISAMCTLGQHSSELTLSALELFEKEVTDHLKKLKCVAGVCFSKETIYVNPMLCTGCEECLDVCEVDCIEGKKGYIHMIDEMDCTRCGKCIGVCEENAIEKTSDKLPKLPDRLTKVGRFKKNK